MITLLLKGLFYALFRFYQWCISPALSLIFGPFSACRFQPSCSNYAHHAIQIHGIWKGIYLSILRILRCHPFGKSGYDPVSPNSHES